jgi:hypothetical protein
MREAKLSLGKFHLSNLAKVAGFIVVFAGCCAALSMAQQQGQKTFPSAEAASAALVTAAQSNDQAAMLEILGPSGKQIVSSGDDAEDSENRANFVRKYREMHRFVKEPDGTTTLYIGAENWPAPIPLVNHGSLWYFNSEAGRKEIMFRRVGRNEASTIRVCQEFVTAEQDYSAKHGEYAGKVLSDEGQHNGLYWKAAEGETQSPIGPLLASAIAESHAQTGAPTPFRGYYYRMLTRQGKNSPGGAKGYTLDGKMTEGFALLAYPAEYGSSGVMTFVVNQDGVVYQKDLGDKTEGLAKVMKEYNPGPGWQKAEDMPEEAAGDQKNQ